VGMDGESQTKPDKRVRKSADPLRKSSSQSESMTENLREEVVPMDHEAVCFPPPGFVPLEIFNGMSQVHWTIMPDSRRYQPTSKLRVRMWRARINTRREDIKSLGHTVLERLDNEWTAERLEEVSVRELKIDCSSHGNPFCIIFCPELTNIRDGDQFEVQVSGLCGLLPELTFFHHFCALRQQLIDHYLIDEASRLRSALADPILWREVQALIPAEPDCEKNDGGHGRKTSKLKRSQTEAFQEVHQTATGPVSMVQIGLVSHPDLEIHTDVVDITIALRCDSLVAIIPALYLSRVSGNEEVPRAAQACRIADQFIVTVKVPMASARYELHFLVTPASAPDMAMQHPLTYVIVSADKVPNLLVSMQHPHAQKFGFAPLVATAQLNRISVIAPVSYRLCIGPVYFLFHVPELATEPIASDGQEHPTSAFSSMTDTIEGTAGGGTTLFSTRLRRYAERVGHTKLATLNWAGDLHQALATTLGDNCQDSVGDLHLDVSIGGRYVLRLKQRNDFPELFEALLNFGEADAGSRVEVFLRRPKTQAEDYAPQKLGEWLICHAECFPVGF